MKGWIGICLGDVTGISPEVTLKALAVEPGDTRFLLIGDEGYLRRTNQQLGLNLPLQRYTGDGQAGRFFIYDPLPEPLPEDLLEGSPAAAKAAVAWLGEAADRCLRHELDAMVTAPVNKLAIVRSGQPFIGQTEFLSHRAGVQRTAMMLLGQDERERWLRVTLVTTHIPLKLVPEQATKARIELAIELTAQSCAELRLDRARIAVCGLNPHAGEGGEMGTEDQAVVARAVAAAKQRGIEAVGPLSPDTTFYQALRGDFDVVVAMYHDQGLAPLKTVAFDTGVNWTLGLPFIRTSPDHGTAYDIAGRGIANPSSMRAAIRLAIELAKSRA